MKAGLTARLCIAASLALAPLALAGDSDFRRFVEGSGYTEPSGVEPLLDGYLKQSPVDFRLVLAPPPSEGSPGDKNDVLELKQDQVPATSPRWAAAEADSASVFDRFSDSFGDSIDRKHAPLLVNLLTRVMRDVSKPTFDAKDFYQRPRPFQRIGLPKICGTATPPKPEAHPTMGSSYPSGHAAYGWAVALVLAQVAPGHAGAVLARGMDYGASRVICGVHFPTDVEAGRLLA